jgi:hypothetical protein
MASYISAVFEKTHLVTADQVRVIVRNRDDGDGAPNPSASYYPTVPDDLRGFIVGNYLNDMQGESFQRVATLADVSGGSPLPLLSLDFFQDTNATFLAGPNPVQVNDIVTITLSNAADIERWQSDEYNSGNPFKFRVKTVASTTLLQFDRPLPSFKTNLTWSISERGKSGTTGATRRVVVTTPGPVYTVISPGLFRDTRFNRYFTSAVTAENAVATMKTDMKVLATADTGASLTTEIVSIGSSI